jgi:hypothetical protein
VTVSKRAIKTPPRTTHELHVTNAQFDRPLVVHYHDEAWTWALKLPTPTNVTELS